MKVTIAKYYIPSGRCIQKLDYSNKVDGKAEAVPEGDIKKFYTANGREVFDGRGVLPDVEVLRPEASNILNGLVTNFITFNWITDFVKNNPDIGEPENFSLTDGQYTEFVNYAKGKEFDYNTATEAYFEELKAVAVSERYLEGAEKEFAELFEKIEPKKDDDLFKFKDQIKTYLEGEIVVRYYYQTGRLKYQLANDEFVQKAEMTFDGNYADILRGE